MITAKLFWTGNSQAIRLPKAFRFAGEEVRIEKQGNKVIIEPVVNNWDWLDELGELDPTFVSAVQSERQTPAQEREWSCFE
ncbi:hypothetical protein RO21_10570 [[Actinobacillus] muris]|uniref:SpoVT-AbrB domain-containing protein n=1 Tax=Muribacter muris TaxID=67855 RepID=A0A0J5P338_9PAST|nr:type II toxin-antitoxin system VapB family antitoxin [Muribacter muris]KMK50661.1 hypothetical protein RO21_10570 [[Actinobacillus] muris] [Muribacter muris]